MILVLFSRHSPGAAPPSRGICAGCGGGDAGGGWARPRRAPAPSPPCCKIFVHTRIKIFIYLCIPSPVAADRGLAAEDVAELLAGAVAVRGLAPPPHHAAAAELPIPAVVSIQLLVNLLKTLPTAGLKCLKSNTRFL